MGAVHAAGRELHAQGGSGTSAASGADAAAAAAAALRGAALRPPTPERRCRVVLAASGARSEFAAVERVFRQCLVDGVRAPSGVNEQPYGHEEALRGAANRLEAAKASQPAADYYVAIESSLTEVWIPLGDPGRNGEGFDVRHFDTGWVLMERAGGGFRAVASSASVEIPAADVEVVKERGLDRKTVGAVVADRVGLLERRDPHAWLTAGRRDRESLLGEAVAVALGQLERSCRPTALGAGGGGAGGGAGSAGAPGGGGADVFRRRESG
eukprot:CAMPEP_0175527034 /NCGR_PEP_ID=MMETSP0096-20121207/19921_1 /TAXON_ID=311494 /ORGANISM="Alexandrium monilatum, Strain CCMP3105" /LENGTH=268 /DNA_ID=CAMNT_0016829679 /DNA_START=48 /DNA_END=851 /DNA_ORIENTATION=+